MPFSRSHPDPAHRSRFVWGRDEFDDALELGERLLYKLTTGDGERVEVARLENGGVRLSIEMAASRVESTLTADEAEQLGSALQQSETPADGSPPAPNV
jgi:hypothetical protein